MIRLGGPVFLPATDPEAWVRAHRSEGYAAAYWPLDDDADDGLIDGLVRAAGDADLAIAEVGAWSNPLSPDDATRDAAMAHCKRRLATAERVGARCCVNISGSRGDVWDGPHPLNLTPDTFGLVVETTREIIDAVDPKRTTYSLETMPWMYPDSVDSYVDLVRAIDREAFSVHLDPVNLICSPQRYFGNADLLRDAIGRLGPGIRSCHAKDIILSSRLTTHLDETRPGSGALDYAVFLTELNGLGSDITVMIEHLATEEDYRVAAAYIRSVAASAGVPLYCPW